MKKILLTILFGVLSLALRSQSLDGARLFDWYYPSESSYQTLADAARQMGRRGWVVSMIQRGEKIPQASARELALDLEFDPRIPAELKARLKAQFPPETSGVTTAGKGAEGRDISNLESQFAALNARMDALEVTIKKNHYDKQTFPSTSASIRAAYVNSGAAGLLAGSNDAHFSGGINVNFDGQGDAGGFSFSISESIDHGNLLIPTSLVFQHGTLGTGAPNFQMGYKDATLSVNLGGGHSLKRSALVLGGKAAPNANGAFVVDMESGNRPSYNSPDLKLGLPYDAVWAPLLIYANKQGTAAYWPFSTTEIFYGPEPGFLEPYNGSKKHLWGIDTELDMGNMWGLVDHNLVYGAITGALNDRDQLRSFGAQDSPAGGTAWALGTDTLLPWGGELFFEYGQSYEYARNNTYQFATPAQQSQIEDYPSPKLITGFDRHYLDQAFVTAYTHPIGVMTIGLEYSHINPFFLPALGAVSSMILTSDNNDPLLNPYGGGIITPWYNSPNPGGHMENGKVVVDKANDVAWGTEASDATGLMNNTDKVVLQSQFSWSWLSLGVFTGIAKQIEPSGPWLKTQPGFESGSNEASAGGDFLLYNHFGGSYYLPAAPLSPAPAKTNLAIFPYFDGSANAGYYLWAFNRPADGMGIDNKGVAHPVHWNALAQFSYRRLDYYVLFSEKGVGDAHIDGFNQKYTNYLAGTLKFDFQAMLGTLTPAEIRVFALFSDVAAQPGTPSFGSVGPAGPSQPYFTQVYFNAFARYGLTSTFSLVGLLGHEEWKSNHSFFPILTGTNEFGLGFDVDLAKILTGLGVFVRSRILYFEDYNIGERQYNAWSTAIGTNLNF
ncbi:MAG: hypothetical protein V4498_04980 [candidate division FCPU426 bacterium]